MEKDQVHAEGTDGDSYEFISDRDVQSITSDSNDVKSTSSTDSGIPLSVAEKALAERIRHLQQENKDLRKAIDNYQKALTVIFSLHAVKDTQSRRLGNKHGRGYWINVAFALMFIFWPIIRLTAFH